MAETRIFFKQGQDPKPSPLLVQLKARAKEAEDKTAREDRGDFLLTCDPQGFIATFAERLARVPLAIERMSVKITKVVLAQAGLPLDPAYSPLLGLYRGESDFDGSWAAVDMAYGKNKVPEVTIDMTVRPNKRDELPLNDFYTAVRSRRIQPTHWYQPIPPEYRLKP